MQYCILRALQLLPSARAKASVRFSTEQKTNATLLQRCTSCGCKTSTATLQKSGSVREGENNYYGGADQAGKGKVQYETEW